jgi:hypothetical protein
MPSLADNLAHVRERLARAAERSGRGPDAVALVAVTKSCGMDTIRGLAALGLRDFGENRVQDLVAKVVAAPPGARWHLIGHLQENKINKVLPHVHLIQSVDGLDLASGLALRAERAGRRVAVLLEVKTSPEPMKHGVPIETAVDVYGALQSRPALLPVGLMTVAPLGADVAALRACFGALRRVQEELRHAAASCDILSMGMSDDFEIAVEEGATMVRIGRALVAA